jgi:hypothetical protein
VCSDLTGDAPRVADLRLHKFRHEIFDRRELQSEIAPPSIDQANLPAEHPLPESAPDPEVDQNLRIMTNAIKKRNISDDITNIPIQLRYPKNHPTTSP